MGLQMQYTTRSQVVLPTAYFKVVNANISNPASGTGGPNAPSVPGFTPGTPVTAIHIEVYATQAARQALAPPVDKLFVAGQPTINVSTSTSVLGVVYGYLLTLPQFSGATST